MTTSDKIKYAVIGQGYIAQVAVLPAFKNARKNSQLVAIVSDDPTKRAVLREKYELPRAWSYDQLDECLEEVDAVYIALPNSMHCEYALRAMRAGRHVLCEKPMALTTNECERMIAAAAEANVKLMVAYRLHFEEANLQAIDLVQGGVIGDAKIFESTFTMQVAEDNIRLEKRLGGGPLYDIGIYCINAARSLFGSEPTVVQATALRTPDPRFALVPETVSATLVFPGGARVATFTCSFGAAHTSQYRVIGTRGDLLVSPAYEMVGKLEHRLTVDGKTHKRRFSKRDQFAPELAYFSQCILDGTDPEPSGEEGLADIRVIEGLMASMASGHTIELADAPIVTHPSPSQAVRKPPVREPELVHAQPPSNGG